MSPPSEEMLRQVFEASPSAMLLVSSDGRIRLVNAQAESLFGYRPGELLGTSVEQLVPARLRDVHPEHRRGYFGDPVTRRMGEGRDLFGLRRDGTEVPIEIGLNPITNRGEMFVLAAVADLTQRKLMEAELRLSEEHQRTVVEAAPNAMIMVGPDGLMALVNHQAEQLFRYDRKDLLGRPVELLVPERFRAPHTGDRVNFMASPSTRRMGEGRDLFGLRSDGSEVPIEIGLNPIVTPEGVSVLAAIIDITQRKRGETQLRASLIEKETLLREIHHRVKNNMQVVTSLLSLQMANIGEPGQRSVFEECQTRVRTMALIHEKLYATGSLAAVDLEEYLRDLSRMMLRSYTRERAHVECELRIEPITLDVDTAIPVGLIVHELLMNSLKHGFPEGSRGKILVAMSETADGTRCLEVRDNGKGLPADFDPAQVKGLGLRMVNGLVRQIDGKLRVRNEGGAWFAVQFGNLVAKGADMALDQKTEQ